MHFIRENTLDCCKVNKEKKIALLLESIEKSNLESQEYLCICRLLPSQLEEDHWPMQPIILPEIVSEPLRYQKVFIKLQVLGLQGCTKKPSRSLLKYIEKPQRGLQLYTSESPSSTVTNVFTEVHFVINDWPVTVDSRSTKLIHGSTLGAVAGWNQQEP